MKTETKTTEAPTAVALADLCKKHKIARRVARRRLRSLPKGQLPKHNAHGRWMIPVERVAEIEKLLTTAPEETKSVPKAAPKAKAEKPVKAPKAKAAKAKAPKAEKTEAKAA